MRADRRTVNDLVADRDARPRGMYDKKVAGREPEDVIARSAATKQSRLPAWEIASLRSQ
jgi:hypothetical protein